MEQECLNYYNVKCHYSTRNITRSCSPESTSRVTILENCAIDTTTKRFLNTVKVYEANVSSI